MATRSKIIPEKEIVERSVGKKGLTEVVKKLYVDGCSAEGKYFDKYVIEINGNKVLLSSKAFQYFAVLALSRRLEEGWVHKDVLEPGGFHQSDYVSRMVKEIGPSYDLVENNRKGSYRLKVSPSIIVFNGNVLKEHEDFVVRNLFLSRFS